MQKASKNHPGNRPGRRATRHSKERLLSFNPDRSSTKPVNVVSIVQGNPGEMGFLMTFDGPVTVFPDPGGGNKQDITGVGPHLVTSGIDDYDQPAPNQLNTAFHNVVSEDSVVTATMQNIGRIVPNSGVWGNRSASTTFVGF